MQAIPIFSRNITRPATARGTMCAAIAGVMLALPTAYAQIVVPAPVPAPAKAPGQEAATPPMRRGKALKQQPHAEISVPKAAYSDDGVLVLCVRITAPKNEGVNLGQAGDPGRNIDDTLYTMEGSYLENETTHEKFSALLDLPNKPNFGPMALLTQVSKGGWLELGVAFPTLPAPADPGRPDSYKLYIPLKAEGVAVKDLPAPPLPKPKTGAPASAAKPKAVASPVKP